MKALLLGSIGTLADTSELQRAAFNAAFREHGLDWSWDRRTYREMLRLAGGRRRIAAQAEANGLDVDATSIHSAKSRIFQTWLAEGRAVPRPGVEALLNQSARNGLPMALVTTTERANVDRLLDGIELDRSTFHAIITGDQVCAGKPASDCYHLAAATLATAPEDCLAVEDNSDGVKAALGAGMACLAWPNENTEGHDFAGAVLIHGNVHDAIYPTSLAAE